MSYMDEYKRWVENVKDEELSDALKNMDEAQIEDAFYRDLEFGTGGLRGTIGAGTNRMNIYTVAKASQGLSDYLVKSFEEPSVAIGYDSRIKSDVFAKTAASVFAANGIKVNLWPRLNPVPTVSFATRYLHTSAGVMVTASHNPSKYNGYKVYGSDGCQMTTEAAATVLSEIEKLDIFADVKKMDFDEAVKAGKIEYISDDVLTAFIEKVKSQSVLFGEEVNKDVSIVYSPLNGTGYIPVTRTLEEMGYTNITIVEEQRLPDGNFPTCPYPNPEIKEAMALGMDYAKRNNADLLLATDPDCDRVGIAVKDKNGEYQLLTGNQTGMLLFDYICSQRTKHGKMPADPVMVKTIVSMDMAEQIAKNYGVRVINVLTGFKFIGEQIGFLEKQGKEDIRMLLTVHSLYAKCSATMLLRAFLFLTSSMNFSISMVTASTLFILISLKVQQDLRKCRRLWNLSVKRLEKERRLKALLARRLTQFLITARVLTAFLSQMYLSISLMATAQL